VAGSNRSGYYAALLESFEGEKLPDKGALSHARSRVSHTFFQEILSTLLAKLESSRRQFKGLRIYAIDGQQLTLPRTADIVKEGFHGRAVSHYRESYLPKAYFTHCYDLLSGLTKDFRFSHRLNEHRDAREMVPGLEENSLTIYDRLYWSAALVKEHMKGKNFFLIRARRAGVPKEITQFFSKRKKFASFQFKGKTLYLIKLRNKETQRYDVFVTNLPRAFISFEKIQNLYRLRWEVETSFRDLTSTLTMEEWHSKSLNGILQELYTALWLVNFTKSQINFFEKKPQNPLKEKYSRPNFKLALSYVAKELARFLQKIKWVYDRLNELIKKSTERRVHLKRAYPRQIRSPASPYKYNNTVWVDLA
jgi:hypothetical protein